MDRMSPLDAAFFRLEDETSPMHIGSVSIMEGPAPSYGDVVRKIVSKLHLVPRYRQRARFVPGGLGRPVWVDDPHFQVLYHVRHTAVPSPGSDRELRNLAGRVLAQPLDRNKPLWEMWVVEGLQDDRWAIISKVHHVMADGVAGSELLNLVFDQTPDATVQPGPPWRPAPPPRRLRLVADALADAVRSPLDTLPAITSAATTVTDPATSARRLGQMVGKPRASIASLNGPTSPHRRWRWTEHTFNDVRTIRRALGGSVNDVVLAVVTRGFRELLLERGEPIDGRVVRSLVPVSVRAEGEQGANRISGVIVELPVGIADPLDRLADLREQMDRLKDSHQAQAGDVLLTMLRAVPAPVTDAALKSVLAFPQAVTQTVTTNVPGPRTPLYILGRRMETCYPYVPLGWRVRIAVAILSYVDQLTFGVTADLDSVPDAGCLIGGIELGFQELLEAANAVAAPPPPKPAAPSTSSSAASRDGKQPAAKKPTAKKTAKKTTAKTAKKQAAAKKAPAAKRSAPAKQAVTQQATLPPAQPAGEPAVEVPARS